MRAEGEGSGQDQHDDANERHDKEYGEDQAADDVGEGIARTEITLVIFIALNAKGSSENAHHDLQKIWRGRFAVLGGRIFWLRFLGSLIHHASLLLPPSEALILPSPVFLP